MSHPLLMSVQSGHPSKISHVQDRQAKSRFTLRKNIMECSDIQKRADMVLKLSEIKTEKICNTRCINTDDDQKRLC